MGWEGRSVGTHLSLGSGASSGAGEVTTQAWGTGCDGAWDGAEAAQPRGSNTEEGCSQPKSAPGAAPVGSPRPCFPAASRRPGLSEDGSPGGRTVGDRQGPDPARAWAAHAQPCAHPGTGARRQTLCLPWHHPRGAQHPRVCGGVWGAAASACNVQGLRERRGESEGTAAPHLSALGSKSQGTCFCSRGPVCLCTGDLGWGRRPRAGGGCSDGPRWGGDHLLGN